METLTNNSSINKTSIQRLDKDSRTKAIDYYFFRNQTIEQIAKNLNLEPRRVENELKLPPLI